MILSFERYGEGFPVVLLHAFPFSRKLWSKQIEPIVQNDFSLITLDLPGFGESLNSEEINSMEFMATSVFETLKEQGIKKAVFGGISMGGYVLFNLYRLYPQLISALIICDTTPKADPPENRKKRFELIKQIENQGMKQVVKNVLPNLLSENTFSKNFEMVKDLENEILKSNLNGTIAALKGMAERKDHTHLLDQIKFPTLLVFGEDDKITDTSTAQNIQKLLPNSTLKIIEDCGHLSNLEKPEKFNKILIEFLLSLNLNH